MPLTIKLLVDSEIAGTKIVLEADYVIENSEGDLVFKPLGGLIFSGHTVGINLKLGDALIEIGNKFGVSLTNLPSFLQEIELEDLYVLYSTASRDLNFIATFEVGGINARIIFQYSFDDRRYVFGILVDITDWGKLSSSISNELDGIEINDAGFIYASEDGAYTLPELITEDSITKISIGEETELNKEFNFPFKIKVNKLVIKTSIADSFIREVIPDIEVDTTSSVDDGDNVSKKWLSVVNGMLEFRIKTHWSLGPVDINALYILLGYKDSKLIIGVAVDVKASLNVFKLLVENIGVLTEITTNNASTGIKDLFDFNSRFKFPNAIALSISAQKFSGGGYLYIGENRYSGVINLNFAGKINFTAIAIINTKLPGGKEGYALLLVIMAEFTPIQLGMGFKLNAMGGLLALHRTMKLDVLMAGVKTGLNERLLFPQDPIENINLILSDLEAVFPIEKDRFVFGPMFILGWGGARALLTVKVGLFIEVPSPVRVAIMGVLNCILPTEGANTEALVLVVNFTGTFDQEKKFITFDASLDGSRLLNFSLDGDMAFRLKYGEKPNFLISVGGFHPAFQPPPLALPSLKRITLNLLDTKDGTVRFETYFAVTSNTVQLGARVDAMFHAGNYDLVGYLGFDALFQFNPFYFQFDTYAGFALMKDGKEKASVSVNLHVDGPRDWNVSGSATAKILGIEFSFDFQKTFGEPRIDESLSNIRVLGLLIEEIKNKDNWEAVLPTGRQELVQIRILYPSDGLVVNPGGSFVISQRIVPLKTYLDKYGNQGVDGPNWFEIKDVSIGTFVPALTKEEDYFAPAQYKVLSETEKVSRPSFEKYDSGVRLSGSDAALTGPYTKRAIKYDEIIIDGPDKLPIVKRPIYKAHFNQLSQGNAAGRSVLAKGNQAKFAAPHLNIPLKEDEFQIVKAGDLSGYANAGLSIDMRFTHSKAKDQLEAILAAHPELEDDLIILPLYYTTAYTPPITINNTESA